MKKRESRSGVARPNGKKEEGKKEMKEGEGRTVSRALGLQAGSHGLSLVTSFAPFHLDPKLLLSIIYCSSQGVSNSYKMYKIFIKILVNKFIPSNN